MTYTNLIYTVRKCGNHWKIIEGSCRESLYDDDSYHVVLNKAIDLAKINLPSEIWIYSEHDELVEKRIYPNFSDIYV